MMRRAAALIILSMLVAGCGLATKQNTGGAIGKYHFAVVRPEAPANIAVTSGDGMASLSWTLPIQSRGCSIEIDRWTAGQLPVLYRTLAPGTMTFRDTNLINGTRYFYLVVVKDENNLLSCCRAMTSVVPVSPPPVADQNISSGPNYGSGSDNSSPQQYSEVMDIVACTFCGGTGKQPGDPGAFGEPGPPKTCWYCSGSGRVKRFTIYANGEGPFYRYDRL